jgi:CAAX prenyl protease-like protein
MCTLTPVLEELAFRGFLARRVVDADFERVDPRTMGPGPFVLSTVAFGLLHPNVLAACGAGAVFFFAYRRSGRLRDAVVAHAVANIFVILATLVTQDARLWG